MSAPSPPIVLVHGAFTDASVWHAVIADLQQGGIIAPALSMRSLAADAASLHSVLDTVEGPIEPRPTVPNESESLEQTVDPISYPWTPCSSLAPVAVYTA